MKMYDEGLEQLIQIAEDAIFDNDYIKGRSLLENGLLEEPGYPKLHYTLGWFYHYYHENPVLARRHYELAIYFDQDYQAAYEELVDLCKSQKQFECIDQYMAKARASTKIGLDYIYETLGRVAETTDQLREAQKFYRLAILNSMDNNQTTELKKTLRRCRFKRIRKAALKLKYWNNGY